MQNLGEMSEFPSSYKQKRTQNQLTTTLKIPWLERRCGAIRTNTGLHVNLGK